MWSITQAFTRRFGSNCRQYGALTGDTRSATAEVHLPVTATWKAAVLRSTSPSLCSRSRRSSTGCGRRRRALVRTTKRPISAAIHSASLAGQACWTPVAYRRGDAAREVFESSRLSRSRESRRAMVGDCHQRRLSPVDTSQVQRSSYSHLPQLAELIV